MFSMFAKKDTIKYSVPLNICYSLKDLEDDSPEEKKLLSDFKNELLRLAKELGDEELVSAIKDINFAGRDGKDRENIKEKLVPAINRIRSTLTCENSKRYLATGLPAGFVLCCVSYLANPLAALLAAGVTGIGLGIKPPDKKNQLMQAIDTNINAYCCLYLSLKRFAARELR